MFLIQKYFLYFVYARTIIGRSDFFDANNITNIRLLNGSDYKIQISLLQYEIVCSK